MTRYLSIWCRHLLTDEYTLRHPSLRDTPFVMASPVRGRLVVYAVNTAAEKNDIYPGSMVADARAIVPSLTVIEGKEEKEKLLYTLAEWCLRYTPDVAVDPPDGLLLNITGCPHLWGGERSYLKDIILKLRSMGYDARAAIADTVGTAWAVARYGSVTPLIQPGQQREALLSLPPEALRLELAIVQKLHKLGLYTISRFIDLPFRGLKRRFGASFVMRLQQALGRISEHIQPIRPVAPYKETLSCIEPIRTAGGIKIAISRLLEKLCQRLLAESKGLRTAILTCYRIDNEIQRVSISTGQASRNEHHLCNLFTMKISSIQPALGIESFLLEATVTEELTANQKTLWVDHKVDSKAIAEMLDKIGGRIGTNKIHRYQPEARYWPEHAYKEAGDLQEEATSPWPVGKPRPVALLPHPEKITVSAPIPDDPPLSFRYKEENHPIIKADGPERIEQEWWLQDGLYRDYYIVEDKKGARYWLFRSGDLNNKKSDWYLHGFFA